MYEKCVSSNVWNRYVAHQHYAERSFLASFCSALLVCWPHSCIRAWSIRDHSVSSLPPGSLSTRKSPQPAGHLAFLSPWRQAASRSRTWMPGVWILTLSLISSASLNKLANFLVPQLPHLQSEPNHRTHVCWMNTRMVLYLEISDIMSASYNYYKW